MGGLADNVSGGTGDCGTHNMIPVKNAHLKFYHQTPLYFKASEGIGFVLYKHKNMTIADARILHDRLPDTLYMHIKDKSLGLGELQAGLNVQLKDDLQSSDPVQVKETLITLVSETLKAPTAESVQGAVATMDVIFSEYLKNRHVIDRLVKVMEQDYTTAAHSVNVMALTLRFCSFIRKPEDEAHHLGLCALLHDVGKERIQKRLLQAPRRLKPLEFEIMKKHTIYGYEILKKCNLDEDICLCALKHHERVDGTGYPRGDTDIPESSLIIGFIDCYEALTCNERPYRSAVSPFDALSRIKSELFFGNFDKGIYREFVHSLRRSDETDK
jgi:putative nucleotidyltransferase with HDIG domain